MSKVPTMPPRPPMREMTTGGRWKNEWETVKWYTDIGSRYPRKLSKWDLFFDKELREVYNENQSSYVDEDGVLHISIEEFDGSLFQC